MHIIEVKNLTKYYGDIIALDNLNLSIEKNEIFGLLGPNGAGKSTLVSIISTNLKPDKGTVIIDAHNITEDDMYVKQTIGIVPQEISLYHDLTAEENLYFFGKMLGVEKNILKKRVDNLLTQVGLTSYKNKLIKHYSGGMKRRINFAIALLHAPKIVIMDEPTVGIDPQSRICIYDLIKELNNKGVTFLISTHYMEEAERLCDRVGIIDNGKLLIAGPPSKLIGDLGLSCVITVTLLQTNKEIHTMFESVEEIEKVVINENNVKLFVKGTRNLLPMIISTFDQFGIKVHSLSVEKPTLETVFIKLTGKKLRD